MKKILFGILAVIAFSLTSCKDEAGNADPGTPVNVAGAVEGTYTGTWTRVESSKPDDIQTGTGTLTFTQLNGENYAVTVVAVCADLDVNYTANANINPAYVFFNSLPTDFGSSFAGRIIDKKDASLKFTKVVKEGRKQYLYDYTFNGTRNN